IHRGRPSRVDGDAVSDRLRDFEEDFTDRGRAAIGPGRDPVGDRRRIVIGADPSRGDRLVIDRFSNVCAPPAPGTAPGGAFPSTQSQADLERFAIACTGMWRELFTRARFLV